MHKESPQLVLAINLFQLTRWPCSLSGSVNRFLRGLRSMSAWSSPSVDERTSEEIGNCRWRRNGLLKSIFFREDEFDPLRLALDLDGAAHRFRRYGMQQQAIFIDHTFARGDAIVQRVTLACMLRYHQRHGALVIVHPAVDQFFNFLLIVYLANFSLLRPEFLRRSSTSTSSAHSSTVPSKARPSSSSAESSKSSSSGSEPSSNVMTQPTDDPGHLVHKRAVVGNHPIGRRHDPVVQGVADTRLLFNDQRKRGKFFIFIYSRSSR